MEERILERNAVCPGEDTQSKGRGSYGGRGGQITQRTGGGYRRGGEKNYV